MVKISYSVLLLTHTATYAVVTWLSDPMELSKLHNRTQFRCNYDNTLMAISLLFTTIAYIELISEAVVNLCTFRCNIPRT